MIKRPETTDMLSRLVEKRLDSNHMYWSSEVDFDKNLTSNRRVDYVGFKPHTPMGVNEPTSVELGTFAFYEVKSSMGDFKSGHGLTFYGDKNYLVCESDLAVQLRDEMMIPSDIDAVLCPNKSGTALYVKFETGDRFHCYRKRTCSEILWAIVQAHNGQQERTNLNDVESGESK